MCKWTKSFGKFTKQRIEWKIFLQNFVVLIPGKWKGAWIFFSRFFNLWNWTSLSSSFASDPFFEWSISFFDCKRFWKDFAFAAFNRISRAVVVVAQLAELSLPMPGISSLNPVNLRHNMLNYWKDENKWKRGQVMAQFREQIFSIELT